MLQQIKKSIAFINNLTDIKPTVAVILGSGLGAFTKDLETEIEIPFHQIPHFPETSVEGHKGALLFARHKGTPVLVMKGRVHFYEGYSMQEITYPVRVFKYLGIRSLLLSNAAGGMNPDFNIGDLMVITDHINMIPNPLVGKHTPEFGQRFPDMSQPYDQSLIDLAFSNAKKLSIQLKQGCYVSVTGPTFETPAEYRFFRVIGGDAVGMSTVPEVIVACQMEIRCFALSVITDLGVPGKIEYVTYKMVQQAAAEAEPRIASLFKSMIEVIS
ncbi:Purine nucleoside phosphorylase 1 [subsurface metagenome]